MFQKYSVNFALFSMALDAVVICLALMAATYLRPFLGFLQFAAPYPQYVPTHWIIYPIFIICWLVIMLVLSLYDIKKRILSINAFLRLTLATIFAVVVWAGTLYISYRMVSRLLFITFILLTYIGIIGWRVIAQNIFVLQHQEINSQRRLLIIGSGQVGRTFQKTIQDDPEIQIHVVGFLDDDKYKQSNHSNILGPTSAVNTIILENNIDDVIIALPHTAHQRINELIDVLQILPVQVWIIPDYFRMALFKSSIEEFAGFPMVNLRAPALSDSQRMIKRILDLSIIIVTMPITLPVICITSLCILVENRGPIIYSQIRLGENGRLFTMYKFRTMITTADPLDHKVDHIDTSGQYLIKSKDDPRVTRLGHLLRRTSIDELPQLYNVLIGNMSLVGPRPELPWFVDLYETWQRQRFAMPQGITGWWQINGRSDKPMHLNTEYDIYYLQNYSIFLDIYILIKTIITVIKCQGAV
jgi:exopolysaccharide biosynthesis polyprenyl glycosylphosphotransferase